LSSLQDFVDNFNLKYPNGNIQIELNHSSNYKMIRNTIKLVSGNMLVIEIIVLLESDFIRNREYDYFGEKRKRTQIEMPLLNKRKIFAWGRLYTHEQTGFNIFLLENPGEIYGEWFLMENTNSGFSRNRRPEPFGFELSELEKEIHYVNTTHIYNSQIVPLEMGKFFEYIFRYNN
ncbi:MAG: hypothetical protein PHE29_14380, partial [Tissierellia bacterium]|nr:hypothetical protein [Tissierellia bacterium]